MGHCWKITDADDSFLLLLIGLICGEVVQAFVLGISEAFLSNNAEPPRAGKHKLFCRNKRWIWFF